MSNENTRSGGIGIAGVLGCIFVVPKLVGVIDWSWWWVTLPFWGGAALAAVRLLIAVIISVAPRLFQKKCTHLRVRETRSCDAICRDCGENLGFIKHWRDANRGNPDAHEISN